MTTTTGRPTTRAANGGDWRQDAACATVDPDLHFPVPHTAGWKKQTRQAKAVCGSCPVRQACLEWALDTRQPSGIWGGMSERERRALLGVRQLHTDVCMERQAWIEKQLAAGVPQRTIADRLGVTRWALRQALAQFEKERAVEGVRAA